MEAVAGAAGWIGRSGRQERATVLLDGQAEESDLFCGRPRSKAAAYIHGVLASFADFAAEDSPCLCGAGNGRSEAGSAAPAEPFAHVAAARGHP